MLLKMNIDEKFIWSGFNKCCEMGNLGMCKKLMLLDIDNDCERNFNICVKNNHLHICKWLLTLYPNIHISYYDFTH